MDICLPVLKESNKSRFDSNGVKNSVFNLSHIRDGSLFMRMTGSGKK